MCHFLAGYLEEQEPSELSSCPFAGGKQFFELSQLPEMVDSQGGGY